MIGSSEIIEILSTYRRHGWILRRVLLTDRTRAALQSDVDGLFGDVPIESSSFDAAWFFRDSSADEFEAWELRRLGGTPFALFRNIPKNSPAVEVEKTLHECEIQLSEYASRPPIDLN